MTDQRSDHEILDGMRFLQTPTKTTGRLAGGILSLALLFDADTTSAFGFARNPPELSESAINAMFGWAAVAVVAGIVRLEMGYRAQKKVGAGQVQFARYLEILDLAIAVIIAGSIWVVVASLFNEWT